MQATWEVACNMWMIIGIFFLMLLIGVPVAFGVGISSMLYLALNG